MKNIFVSIAIIFNIVAVVSAPISGWEKFGTNYHSETLNDIISIKDSIIIAVGDLATIKRSDNYGESWQIYNADYLKENLNFILNFNDVLYACGNNGYLISSFDYGIKWDTIYIGTSSNLNAIIKINQIMYIVGDNGFIAYSEDNGKNWIELDLKITDSIIDIEIFDDSTILILSEKELYKYDVITEKSTKILTSKNDKFSCLSSFDNTQYIVASIGSSFFISNDSLNTLQEIKYNSYPSNFVSAQYVNDSTIIAGFYYTIGNISNCYSLDSGKTWNIIGNSDEPFNFYLDTQSNKIFAAGFFGDILQIDLDKSISNYSSRNYLSKNNIFSIDKFEILDDTTFVAKSLNTLLISNDTCKTWNKTLLPKNSNFNDFTLSNSKIIVFYDSMYSVKVDNIYIKEIIPKLSIFNYNGELEKQIILLDSGVIQKNSNYLNRKMVKINESEVLVYAYNILIRFNIETYEKQIKIFDEFSSIKSVYVEENIIKMIVLSNELDEHLQYISFDYGVSWEESKINIDFYYSAEFKYFNSTSIWMIVSPDNKIYKSNDGGIKWELIFNNTSSQMDQIGDIYLFGESKIIGTGFNILIYSIDDGTTWTENVFKSFDRFLPTFIIEYKNYLYLSTSYGSIFRKMKNEVFTSIKLKDYISKEILLYPNPATDFITINSENILKYQTYEICDIMGRAVQSGNIESDKIILNDFPTGIYFLKLIGTTETKSMKFVRE